MSRFLRSFFLTLTLLLGGWILSSTNVFAAPQINNQINYQARLMDASGFPVADGNYSIKFSLYDAASAGTRLWSASGTTAVPTALTVNVQNGLFSILLGDTSAAGGSQNSLDTVNWNSDQIFLGVTIAADSEMLPRKRFASAPQAFNSRQLQGMYASSTASGGQTLFTVNQTEATAATGTRTALDVKTNGTSNANDFLIRGLDNTNTAVFTVNRQGNATTSFLNATNVFVSGLTTSTSLNANIATFATATVAGRGVCLSDGSFCQPVTGGSATDTNWSFNLLGDFVRNATATTDVVIGSSTYSGAPFVFQNNSTTSRLIIGKNTSTGAGADVVIGASTSSGMNSLFQLSGDDLFVAGNIGSASSVYTNGSFIAGTGTTYYGDGFVSSSQPGFIFKTAIGYQYYASSSLLATIAYDGIQLNAFKGPAGGGGDIDLNAAYADSGSNYVGGNIGIHGGGGDGTGDGGALTLTSGNGGSSGDGGALNINAGSGSAATAGDVVISGGSGLITAKGGNVSINGGDGASAPGGDIVLSPGNGSINGTVQISPHLFTTGILRFMDLGSNYVGLRAPNAVTSNYDLILPLATGASGTAMILNSSNQLNFLSVCLADGTNCPASAGNDTLLTVSNRGAIATSTLTLFGGFVAASSSVTGTLNVAGGFHVTGTANIALSASSTPFTIRIPAATPNDQSLGFLLTPSSSSRGISMGKLNFTNDYSLFSFSNNALSPLSVSGTAMYFDHTKNEYVMQLLGDGGLSNFQTTFRMADLDSGQVTARAAFELRNESTNSSTRVLLLENGPSMFISQHVGSGSPEGVVYDETGSIYFNPSGSASGTQAYLKATGGFSNTGWKGIATVDMLTGGGGGGGSTDTNWTFNLLGDFVRNTTATTDVVIGSSTYAGAPFVFTNNTTSSRLIVGQNQTTGAKADVVIGATTSSGMKPEFQLTGKDLFVAGNIGSASSVYTNGSFVAGSSTTYFSENEIATNVPVFNIHATSGSEIAMTVSSTKIASFMYDGIELTAQHKSSGGGGGVTITGGYGQPGTDGPGGTVYLYGGNADTAGVTGEDGGGISLNGGQGWGFGNSGGDIVLSGGSGDNSADAGGVVLYGGSVFGANGNGGNVTLSASAGAGTGSGGSMFLYSGDSYGAANAGSMTFNVGSGYGGGDAGNLVLNAGYSFSSGQAGNIVLNPGFSSGSGDAGHISIPSTFGYAPPDLRFVEAGTFGSDFVGFRAPDSVTSSTIWKLPGSDGSAGQVITTDGLGNLSFSTPSGGSSTTTDFNWIYNNASGFVRSATTTNDIVFGASATSTGAPVYFDMNTGTSTVFFGFSTNTNVVIGGTSSTPSGMPLFTMDGNDLLVTGTIGTDTLFASGRVDAPYLNRWFTSPLLTQTIYKGGSTSATVSGSAPRGVAFDGSYIWVTDYSAGTGNLNKIDPLTNRVIATTTIGGGSGGADQMAFDGKYLWVANGFSTDNNLSKVDPITNRVVAVVPLGGDFLYAQSVAFDGTYIWVTETGTFPASSVVRKVDPVANTVVASVPVGVDPYGIAFDGKYLWVANFDSASVSKIDPQLNTVVATTTVGGTPLGVVYDGTSIWVSTNFGQTVVKVNPVNNAVVATISVTGDPQYMAYDGRYIWVGQNASSSVTKIDPMSNSIVENIVFNSQYGGALGMAFDGSHMWIATPQVYGSTVTKIPIGAGSGYASTSLSVLNLTVNSATGSATGTSNYAVSIKYASSSSFGGVCIDDANTGPTCPTTPGGASLVADGAIIANRFDLAESYEVTGGYEPGDVLVLDASSTATVKRSTGIANDAGVVGIASTDPGFVLGWNGGARVALTGRVPVKISMNQGVIHVGDAVAAADVPGYAMKATQPGMILGYALQDASATGTAEVMVQVGFWAGLAFGPDGGIQVDHSGNVSIMHDLHVGGKLFPSLKGGGIQDDWYLFVDDTDASSTYISTNASGFQSLDTYDFAERYYSPDELEPGDLVIVSDSGRTHVQRSWNVDAMLLGIVSTRPAFIAGRPATSTYPIALSGRVPTKVSNMNGPIKAGDPLSPTTIPGVAAKAIHSGPIVGLALEDFEGANIDKIEVYVNPGYWVNKNESVSVTTSTSTIAAPTVVSNSKQGFATITAGATKVHIEFPSLGAYPNVQVTPRGSVHGGWWTDQYTDRGFDIMLSEAESHDVIFAWRVEASTANDIMRMSDGTYGAIDPLTGVPELTAPTSTPDIPEPTPPPLEAVTSSTDPVENPADSSATST